MEKTLELSGNRTLTFPDGGKQYLFQLSPVTQGDWLKRFDGIESRSRVVGKERHTTFDSDSSMIEMVDRLLIDATGYLLPEGITAIKDVPDWKRKIPLRHRGAIGRILTDVEVVEDGALPEFGMEAVTLRALWNHDAQGSMVRHSPLVHRFRPVEFEQLRRYKRDQSRSTVVGGSRTGETVYHGDQRSLIDLYDELIESVEGYTCSGAAVTDPARQMDAFHKVTAATQLFVAPAIGEDAV